MWRHNNNVQYNNVIYTFGIYQLCSCGHRESTHIVIVIHSRVCFYNVNGTTGYIVHETESLQYNKILWIIWGYIWITYRCT